MLLHIMVSMLRLGTDVTPYGRLWGEDGGVLRCIRRYEVSTTRRTKRVESCWWSDRNFSSSRLLFSAM
jgi:hypothetical protein